MAERGCFDLMLLTETIQMEAYSHKRMGYNVIDMWCSDPEQGGHRATGGLVSLGGLLRFEKKPFLKNKKIKTI